MGHGHVRRSSDGSVARCGGPAACSDCALEKASVKPDGNIHVVPTSGPQHYEIKECWCEPTLSFKDQKEVWSHKGYEELHQ